MVNCGGMDDLHTRIRRWREAAGMTRALLAEKCGVSPASVTYWEAPDGHGPATDRLAVICEVFGVSMSTFFGHMPPEKVVAAPEAER